MSLGTPLSLSIHGNNHICGYQQFYYFKLTESWIYHSKTHRVNFWPLCVQDAASSGDTSQLLHSEELWG